MPEKGNPVYSSHLLSLAAERFPINITCHKGTNRENWSEQAGQTYRGPGGRWSLKWAVMMQKSNQTSLYPRALQASVQRGAKVLYGAWQARPTMAGWGMEEGLFPFNDIFKFSFYNLQEDMFLNPDSFPSNSTLISLHLGPALILHGSQVPTGPPQLPLQRRATCMEPCGQQVKPHPPHRVPPWAVMSPGALLFCWDLVVKIYMDVFVLEVN